MSCDEKIMKAKNVSSSALAYAFGAAFSSRHVAPGTKLKSNGRIVAHTASTLKGSSGGPMVDPASFWFGGIRM